MKYIRRRDIIAETETEITHIGISLSMPHRITPRANARIVDYLSDADRTWVHDADGNRVSLGRHPTVLERDEITRAKCREPVDAGSTVYLVDSGNPHLCAIWAVIAP